MNNYINYNCFYCVDGNYTISYQSFSYDVSNLNCFSTVSYY